METTRKNKSKIPPTRSGVQLRGNSLSPLDAMLDVAETLDAMGAKKELALLTNVGQRFIDMRSDRRFSPPTGPAKPKVAYFTSSGRKAGVR